MGKWAVNWLGGEGGVRVSLATQNLGILKKGGIGVKDIWYWRADVVYGRV